MNDEQVSSDTIQFPVSESKALKQSDRHVVSVHYFGPFQDKLIRIERGQIENCWTGKQPLTGMDGGLRIMTVVYDETAGIAGCHFMALRMTDGRISTGSIEQAHNVSLQQALATTNDAQQSAPGYTEQTAHWPDNWRALVARELGIPPISVHDRGVGGPLLTAHTGRCSIKKSARIHANSLRLKLGIESIAVRKPKSDYRGVVEFSMTTPIQPWAGDPSHYLLEVAAIINAVPSDVDDYEPEDAGEMTLLIIKLAEARKAGVSISVICDSHSSDLEEVWAALFTGDEFKEGLGLSAPSGDLVYIHDISLDPDYEGTPLFVQVIETAIATFGSRGLVVAYQSDFNNEAKIWRKLGFKEIPRTGLLVRSPKWKRFGY